MKTISQATIVGAIVAVFIGGPSHAEDWPRWRGPRGDGSWNAPRLPEQWPPGGPRRVWRQRLGGGYAGIAVADGRVVTMDRQKAAPGTPQADGTERVVCFDAASGKPLWTHAYPTRYGKLGGYANGPRAMPTIHEGRVYTLGAVGHLYCLEAATGKVVWSKDLVRDYQARIPEWGLAASPLVDGDRVVVHAGAQPGGSFLAFDRRTGKEIWRSLDDPAGYCTPVLIERPAGRQLIAWTPENVHGLDPETGKRLWSVPYAVTYGVSIATPIIREDIVFVTGYWEGSKAIRLGSKPTDGTLLWEDSRQLRGLMAQPLYRDGCVFTIDKSIGLVCFELKTGKKLWDDGHRMTPAGRNPHASMVWLNEGDRVLILNAAGELILARLGREGYREQSRVKVLDVPVWSHPAFAGEHIFVRGDGAERPEEAASQELICYRLVE